VVVFLLPINQAYEVCFCFSVTCLQTLLPLCKTKSLVRASNSEIRSGPEHNGFAINNE